MWWDEHHKKVRLGHASKHECLISRDADGNVCEPAAGGSFPERRPTTTMKFPPEARGSFGLAMRKKSDGSMEGVKCSPFCYNNRRIVGPKEYERERQAELRRVVDLAGPWRRDDFGYKERYGDKWSEELDKVLQNGKKKLVPVTKVMSCLFSCSMPRPLTLTSSSAQMMDHIVSESSKVYAGTEYADTFLIFHDGLSQWWEPDAQAHLEAPGFRDRQLRCLGDTNKGNHHYEGKVVGDSPELRRGLDSYGFADLEAAVTYNCALSSVYDLSDPRRFSMGTPDAVWSALPRCWEVAPTSERIVEDISALPRVLDVIIEHQGAVVLDLFLRSGRRARQPAKRGKKPLARAPRARQRKDTLAEKPRHPDNDEAHRKLLAC